MTTTGLAACVWPVLAKTNMKRILAFAAVALLCCCCSKTSVLSPDGTVEACFKNSQDGSASLEITVDGEKLLDIAEIGLYGDNLESTLSLRGSSTFSKHETLRPVVWQKSEVINNDYNGLLLKFNSGRKLEVRAFDNGIAYRWVVECNNRWQVDSETAKFIFGGDAMIWPVCRPCSP